MAEPPASRFALPETTATVETLDQSLINRAIAFTLLGASGTYLLLPHRHGLVRPAVAHRIGYALVALAVAVFATFLAGPRPAGDPVLLLRLRAGGGARGGPS